MKLTIVLKDRSGIAIVTALLPSDLLASCRLLAVEERSTLVSVARTHLIKHHSPIAVMIDTDTLDPTIIAETVGTTRYLMSAVAGETPFEIIYCVPHLEAIFFEAPIDFQRIFPNFSRVFILQFAKTQPKNQLDFLLKEGGGPGNLSDFLNELTADDIVKLQATYQIQHLMAFIKNNRELAKKP
jgi:hypothetical protein